MILNGSDNMKVLLIVPAYNEEKNIKNTITGIRDNACFADCIVINDCSIDGTKNVLDEICVPYIDLPSNLGIGGCVPTGYLYALENDYDIDSDIVANYSVGDILPVAIFYKDNRYTTRDAFCFCPD